MWPLVNIKKKEKKTNSFNKYFNKCSIFYVRKVFAIAVNFLESLNIKGLQDCNERWGFMAGVIKMVIKRIVCEI